MRVHFFACLFFAWNFGWHGPNANLDRQMLRLTGQLSAHTTLSPHTVTFTWPYLSAFSDSTVPYEAGVTLCRVSRLREQERKRSWISREGRGLRSVTHRTRQMDPEHRDGRSVSSSPLSHFFFCYSARTARKCCFGSRPSE